MKAREISSIKTTPLYEIDINSLYKDIDYLLLKQRHSYIDRLLQLIQISNRQLAIEIKGYVKTKQKLNTIT